MRHSTRPANTWKMLRVETDGERRPDYPKVYTKIMLKFRMKGPDLTDKDVRDAIHESLTPHLQHRRYGESGGPHNL